MVRRNTFILNSIARAMNAGGCALVSAFDAGSSAFDCTMSALSPGEKSKLAGRIKAFEKKIQALSAGIANETSRHPDPATALASESVIAAINSIKELNTEIELMKQRIAELDAAKSVKSPQQDSAGVCGFFVKTLSGIMPGEKAALHNKILTNEKKIRDLYSEFAREAAKQVDPGAAITSDTVAAVIAKINVLKSENNMLKLHIADMAKPKADKQRPKPAPAEKKAQPESCGVGKFFMHAISNTISGCLPGEKANIDRTVAEHEKKIQGLYVDVAKESAKYPDPADALTAEPVIGLLAKINELKAAITALNQRKAGISDLKEADKVECAAVEVKADFVDTEEPVVSQVTVDDEVTSDSSAALPDTETVVETSESANIELADDTAFESDRRKQCQIPVPILQPPTPEDIADTIRDIQATDAQKEEDSEVLNEETTSVVVTEVADAGDEAPASLQEEEQETAPEMVVETAPDYTIENPETSAVPEDATDDGQTLATLAEEEEVISEAPAAEADPNVFDETITADSGESIALDPALEPPPSLPVYEDEDVTVPQDEPETSAEAVTETESEESADNDEEVVAAPAEEPSQETPVVEENLTGATAVPAGFFGTSSGVPTPRPEAYFSDKSEPVFRTRVYRNEFSILTAEPAAQKNDAGEVVEEHADNAVAASVAEEVPEQQEADTGNAESETAEVAIENTVSDEAEETSDSEEDETSSDNEEDESATLEQTESDGSAHPKKNHGRKKRK